MSAAISMPSVSIPPVPVGALKSFGVYGPIYQVGQPLHPLPDNDWMVEILLVETGETAEYRLARLNDDPEAK